jgi:hypothetical protein
VQGQVFVIKWNGSSSGAFNLVEIICTLPSLGNLSFFSKGEAVSLRYFVMNRAWVVCTVVLLSQFGDTVVQDEKFS